MACGGPDNARQDLGGGCGRRIRGRAKSWRRSRSSGRYSGDALRQFGRDGAASRRSRRLPPGLPRRVAAKRAIVTGMKAPRTMRASLHDLILGMFALLYFAGRVARYGMSGLRCRRFSASSTPCSMPRVHGALRFEALISPRTATPDSAISPRPGCGLRCRRLTAMRARLGPRGDPRPLMLRGTERLRYAPRDAIQPDGFQTDRSRLWQFLACSSGLVVARAGAPSDARRMGIWTPARSNSCARQGRRLRVRAPDMRPIRSRASPPVSDEFCRSHGGGV